MDFGPMRRVSSENAWVIPTLGVIGVVATFTFAGPVAGLMGVAVFVVIAIAALARSLLLAHRQIQELTASDDRVEAAISVPDTEEEEHAALEAAQGTSGPQREGEDEFEDSPVFQAIRAAFERNLAEVHQVLDPWVEDVEGDEKISRKAFRLRALLIAGDRAALEGLRQLADDNPERPEPVSNLATALESLGERDQAVDELDRRTPRVAKEAQADLRIRKCSLLREKGELEAALGEARALAQSTDIPTSTRAAAFQQEGLALEDLGRPIDAVAAFERSLSADPTNDWLRFHAAYQYAELGYGDLAALHYSILMERYPYAHNNLAVRLQIAELSLLAIDGFKKSASFGEALGAANIANALIAAGFAEEAGEWIARGETMKSPHQNVATAKARLANARNDEKKAFDEMLERARATRQVFSILGAETPEKPLASRWRFDTGEEVELVQEGLAWKGSTGSGTTRFAITIEASGSALLVTVVRGEFIAETHRGWGVLTGDSLLLAMKDWPQQGRQSVLRADRIESASNGERTVGGKDTYNP